MAVKTMADALSRGGSAYASDNDPELSSAPSPIFTNGAKRHVRILVLPARLSASAVTLLMK